MGVTNTDTPALNMYRVVGSYRVRMFSADQSDTIGTVVEYDTSNIVTAFDEAWAGHSAVQQVYLMLDSTGEEYEPIGWRSAPEITFCGVVKPAKIKQAQVSMFDMAEAL